jgi:hypothetical protein
MAQRAWQGSAIPLVDTLVANLIRLAMGRRRFNILRHKRQQDNDAASAGANDISLVTHEAPRGHKL